MKKFLSVLLVSALVFALVPASVFASAPKDIAIHEINVEGFVPPVVGSTPEFSYNIYIEENDAYFMLYPYWHDNTGGTDMTTEQTPFEAGNMYSVGCVIVIEDGYYIAEDCVFSFNGDPNLVDPDYPQPYYLGGCIVLQSTPVAPVSSAAVPGDADGDGEVTVTDALMVLRAALELVELTDEQTELADVNGDGSVTLSDALLILRAALGLIEL